MITYLQEFQKGDHDAWGGDRGGDYAVLAVDELATNAVLHGVPPYELRLYTDPAGWGVVDHADGVITVHARLSRIGEAHVAGEFPLSETGRGLLLVGRLYPGRCGVRAVLNRCGRPAKEVAFTLPPAAVANIDAEERPGAPPLAGTGQRGR